MGAFTHSGKRRVLKAARSLIGWAATNEERECALLWQPLGYSTWRKFSITQHARSSSVPSPAVMEERLEIIDTDLLINEIEKRPALWDMQSSDYKDKNLKKRCWKEIADIFCSSGDMKEKQTMGKLTE